MVDHHFPYGNAWKRHCQGHGYTIYIDIPILSIPAREHKLRHAKRSLQPVVSPKVSSNVSAGCLLLGWDENCMKFALGRWKGWLKVGLVRFSWPAGSLCFWVLFFSSIPEMPAIIKIPRLVWFKFPLYPLIIKLGNWISSTDSATKKCDFPSPKGESGFWSCKSLPFTTHTG